MQLHRAFRFIGFRAFILASRTFPVFEKLVKANHKVCERNFDSLAEIAQLNNVNAPFAALNFANYGASQTQTRRQFILSDRRIYARFSQLTQQNLIIVGKNRLRYCLSPVRMLSYAPKCPKIGHFSSKTRGQNETR